MQPALAIFSGIRFPYYVAEKAIRWAKEHRTGVHVLFVQESEKEEGYLFPNDLDAAEKLTTVRDANQDDQQLIASRIKVLKDMAIQHNVDFNYDIVYNPSLEQVLQKANAASQVFVDATPQEVYSDARFDMERFIRQTPVPLERVGDRQ